MFQPLPDKPSEIVEIALHDLEVCENSPAYEIDMSRWYDTTIEEGVCRVCLAGAVLASRMVQGELIPRQITNLYSIGIGDKEASKYDFLDRVRLMDELFLSGKNWVFYPNPMLLESMTQFFAQEPPVRYEDNPQAFKMRLRYFIKHLKADGH